MVMGMFYDALNVAVITAVFGVGQWLFPMLLREGFYQFGKMGGLVEDQLPKGYPSRFIAQARGIKTVFVMGI